MRVHTFSHNDIVHRITAEPGQKLKIYTIDNDDKASEFVPPTENRYNQILRVKFGLSEDTFQSIRKDWMPSWIITEIVFYDSAFSIRRENVFDKPVIKDTPTRTFHGVHAEQIYTETIPYDNISQGEFFLRIDLRGQNGKCEAKWLIAVFKDSYVITTPADMSFERPRIHL